MAYDKYEDRLTTIKNHEEIEKLICEALGYDPKNTKFFREGKYDVKDCVMFHNAIDKLGQLEDIEEELSIDLIMLFKTQKFYAKCNVRKYEKNNIGIIREDITYNQIVLLNKCDLRFDSKEITLGSRHSFNCYKLKDYGKTWALTKEELESGK